MLKNNKDNKKNNEDKKNKEKQKRQIKWKLLIYALIEFTCIVLTFFVSYYFAIPAVLFMLLGQREIWGRKPVQK